MDLVFFGSGAFGLPVLEELVARHTLRLVVSQPDRPAGRKRQPRATPVSSYAESHGLPLHRTADANADAATIRAVPADAWVVIAFGQKLSPSLLAGQFAINLHASLLPRWRGAAPIHHAIMAGDPQAGVSVITLADRMDAGDVLASASVEIGPAETTGDLHDRLAELGPTVIGEVLAASANGTLHPAAQDEKLATAAPKLHRGVGRVEPSMAADAARRRINGCGPWPGCDAVIGGDTIRLLRAAPCGGAWTPGMVSSDGVMGFADAGVQLLEVQRQGGRPSSFADWARGRHHGWPVAYEAAP